MKRIAVITAMLVSCAASALAGSYNYVAPAEFKTWLESGKKVQIVDIQVPAEFQKQHFQGSMETNAYPVKSADEKQRLEKVVPVLAASQVEVVVICPRGGGGAKNTYDYLKEKGIPEARLRILEKGVEGWPYKELLAGAK